MCVSFFMTDKGPRAWNATCGGGKFTQGSFFKVGRLLFHWNLSPSLPPITSWTSPLYHSLSVSYPVCLPVCPAACLSDFSSHSRCFSIRLDLPSHPHLHTHVYTHTHTSSIAIPERSRRVWQWVGLCPWTQWHPCYRCITPHWHHQSQVATLQWR